MTLFLFRRLLQGLLMVLVASMLVFVGVYAIGDPMSLLVPPDATTETREAARQALGLDRPLYIQYFAFLTNAVQGDLGISFVFRESALKVILERLPATLELASASMLLAIVIGIPFGVIAGMKPGGLADRALLIGSVLGLSLPTFWIGILLILFFAVNLGVLPASGRGDTVEVFGVGLSFLTLDGLRHLVLPALSLSLLPMAILGRLTRSGVIEAMSLDFARFARAQGNTRSGIVTRYVLRYISMPLVTVVGIYFGTLIAFAVVTESVFSWPGMGKLIIESINQLDRPMVVAYMMLSTVLFMFINLAVDIIYSLLDPRVRLK
ncbi:ABC transporter permease [Pseudohalocynthiibacter aestuariivivens]|uniref:ABC transporter permease n=1 Tax=Roseovarius pelagicus TaxID=2980108 RepID=A0ABY6DAK3_9RHOB|nr:MULTISPECIES: ABC transporter permease [Rhodobacterales]MBW4976351.1 ABC transporter permease [Roseovarius mucosus]QIE44926.1 ABC transporter permease [Pseudohalocynthiibacter aestuariivivens]UXX83177.1 ABC transporter permease [Roseovarius pelagicus]